MFLQRAVSSSSGAAHEASPTRLNIAAIASTSLAAGSIAWYYHMYGPEAFAMTPAEEGYVLSIIFRIRMQRRQEDRLLRHKCWPWSISI